MSNTEENVFLKEAGIQCTHCLLDQTIYTMLFHKDKSLQLETVSQIYTWTDFNGKYLHKKKERRKKSS